MNGYTIIKKKDINVGMAAALPSGNLTPGHQERRPVEPGGHGEEGERPGQAGVEGKLLPMR
ncbi:MAG: hypothetical protein R2818_03680 [Flavobacteriales bacterium]